MYRDKKVLAVIPARGGSKRLPKKNVRKLAGKPLLNWTIDAAIQCNCFDSIIVSTDDLEISEIAIRAGAEVPELRPDHLASDTATTEDLVIYILNHYDVDSDIIVILQPTSPLRKSWHIQEAIELFDSKNAYSVVSVSLCEHPPQWTNVLPSDSSLEGFIRESDCSRSQDLQQLYRLNGAVFVYDVKQLKERKKMKFYSDSFAYKMDSRYSIDIDSQLDFDIAEFLLVKNEN